MYQPDRALESLGARALGGALVDMEEAFVERPGDSAAASIIWRWTNPMESRRLTRKMIEEEVEQVKATGLDSYAQGFFSRSGFEGVEASDVLRLYNLEEMYR